MKIMIVIQPSHPGLLAEVTEVLAANTIDIIDISGQTVGHTAVIRLQAEPYEEGFRVLSDAGYSVYATRTLLVRLKDAPGALAQLSQKLANAGVDIRGLQIVHKDEQIAIAALDTADQDKARTVLKDMLVDSMTGSTD